MTFINKIRINEGYAENGIDNLDAIETESCNRDKSSVNNASNNVSFDSEIDEESELISRESTSTPNTQAIGSTAESTDEGKLTQIPQNITVPHFSMGCAVINDDNTVTVYENVDVAYHAEKFEIRIYDRNGNLLSTTRANYRGQIPHNAVPNGSFNLNCLAETTETTFTEFASEKFINNFIQNSSIPTASSSSTITVTKEDGTIEEIVYRGNNQSKRKKSAIDSNVSNSNISSSSDMANNGVTESRYKKISRYSGGDYQNGDCPISSKTITLPDGKVEVYEYWENGNIKSKQVYDTTSSDNSYNKSGNGKQINGKLIESTTYWENGNVKHDKDGDHDRNNPDIVVKDGKVYYKGEMIYGVKDENGNFRTRQIGEGAGNVSDTSYYNEQLIGQLYEEKLANYDPSSGTGLISSKSLCYCVEADECYIGNTKVSQDTALAIMDKAQYTSDLPSGFALFVHTINGQKVYTVRTNDGQSDPNYFTFTEEEFKLFEQEYEKWENQPKENWMYCDDGTRFRSAGIFTGAFCSNHDGGDYYIGLTGRDTDGRTVSERDGCTLIDACFDYTDRFSLNTHAHGDIFYVNSLGIVSKRGSFLGCPHLDVSENNAFYWVRKLINGDTSDFKEANEGDTAGIGYFGEVEGSAPKRGEYYHLNSSTSNPSSDSSSNPSGSDSSAVTNSSLIPPANQTDNSTEGTSNTSQKENVKANYLSNPNYIMAKQKYDTLKQELNGVEAEKEKAKKDFQKELNAKIAEAKSKAEESYNNQEIKDGEEETPYEIFYNEEMAKISDTTFDSSSYNFKISMLKIQIASWEEILKSFM